MGRPTPRPAALRRGPGSRIPSTGRFVHSVLAVFESVRGSILTHNSTLGRDHPDLVVRNCFGTDTSGRCVRPTRRCATTPPCSPPKQVRDLPLEGLSIEAYGQLGAAHGGQHDKTAGAYTALGETILSICCCDACRRSWSLGGLDPDATQRALQEASTAAAREGATATPEDLLGTALAGQLLSQRQHHTESLLAQVMSEVSAVNSSLRITLHAQSDPWATGASPGLTPGSAHMAHCVLVPIEPTDPESAALLSVARSSIPAGVATAAVCEPPRTDPSRRVRRARETPRERCRRASPLPFRSRQQPAASAFLVPRVDVILTARDPSPNIGAIAGRETLTCRPDPELVFSYDM